MAEKVTFEVVKNYTFSFSRWSSACVCVFVFVFKAEENGSEEWNLDQFLEYFEKKQIKGDDVAEIFEVFFFFSPLRAVGA